MSESAEAPETVIGTNEHEQMREQERIRESSALPERPLLPSEVRVVKKGHRRKAETEAGVYAWVGPRPSSVVFDPEVEMTQERAGDVAGTQKAVFEDPAAYIGQEGHPPTGATVVKFTVETPKYYQTYSYGPGPDGDWVAAQGTHTILFPAPWLVMDRIPKNGSMVATALDEAFHGKPNSHQPSGVEWVEIDSEPDTPRSE
jgi:hypothetical protein